MTADEECEEDVQETLLSGVAESTWIPRRTKVAIAVVTAVAACACLTVLSRPAGFFPAAPEDVQSLYEAQQSCYAYTGGSCSVSNCAANRRATCQSRKCACLAGCSSANGTCMAGATNLPVASSIVLHNKKWPNYYMYVQRSSVTGQIKTTNAYEWTNGGSHEFSIFKLPGLMNGQPKFFLGSVHWPDHVARIGLTAGTAASTHGFYSTDLGGGYSPTALALTMCRRSDGTIMIGQPDSSSPRWAYIHHGSWLVYATSGNVGEGGYWTPSTPIPAGVLPAC